MHCAIGRIICKFTVLHNYQFLGNGSVLIIAVFFLSVAWIFDVLYVVLVQIKDGIKNNAYFDVLWYAKVFFRKMHLQQTLKYWKTFYPDSISLGSFLCASH